MAEPILPAFARFPKEAAIIGRILAGYTTLEVSLLNCVQIVRDDFDSTLKAMFRVRSEGQRIDIGDALGRHFYSAYKLGTEFEMAISSLRHCMKIRNIYAHCVWYDDNSGDLAFVNIEDIAKANEYQHDFSGLSTMRVKIDLLNEQESYFVNTDCVLRWINYEGRVRAGTLSRHVVPKPKQMKQPPLHIP